MKVFFLKKDGRTTFFSALVISLLLTVILPVHSFAGILINPTNGGGFESGSDFASNGWTVVNNGSGTMNNWNVGTASGSGSNFAYISNTGGSTHNYDVTTTSIVHFYQSVTIPAGETNIQLNFLLKSIGELNTDRMLVYTGTGALTAGSLPGAGYTAVFTQNSTSTWVGYQTVYLQLSSALAGTTFNVVFTWQNNNSAGSQPPASVDNVSLTSASCIISSFPWTEGFESMPSTGVGVIPPCWATQYVSGNFNWTTAANGVGQNGGYGFRNIGARSGTKYIYSSYNSDAWVFTPGMQLTGGNTYYFYYYYSATDAVSGFTINTAVGTSQTSGGMTTTLITLTNPVNTTYKFALCSYTPGSDGVYYFGIHSQAINAPYYFDIDDVSLSTTSPCLITSFPWTEGFETTSAGGGNAPSCWLAQATSGTNWATGTAAVRNGIGAHSGGTHYMYSTWSSDAWLYTPAFQLSGGSTYYFSYYYAVTDANATGINITTAVGTSQSSAAMTTTIGTITNPLLNTYRQAVYAYTPPSTGAYYFGIRNNTPGTPGNFNVDDVALQTDDCHPPTTNSVTIVSTTSANANWTCTGCTGSYIVEYGVASSFTTPGTGATAGPNGTVVSVSAGNVSTLLSGLSTGTQYRYFVRQNCGSSYSVNLGQQLFATDYCTSGLYTTGCSSNDAIIRFTVSNLNHTNSGCSTAGYGNFTASQPTINFVRNVGYNWSCSINFGTGHYVQMWIDYDDNGIFDASEALLAAPLVQSGGADPATFGSSFTIPAAANTGNHRFRVRAVYTTASFDACTQYTYGEVQDYTCNINAPSCTVPSSSAATAVDLTSAQANWTCDGCTGSYIVEYGLASNFTTPGTDANAGANGTVISVSSGNLSTVISGLANGTQYRYFVRQNCAGTYSLNSASQTFTTLIPLAVGTIVANQQTATTVPGTNNVNIWRLDIPASGTLGTITLNSIKFTSGNTNDADIAASGVKLWTGTVSAPSSVIGTQTFSSGSVTFSGLNMNIPASTTYLWLTCNIASSAIVGDVADVKINTGDVSLTASGGAASVGTQPPALLDPAGNVLIDYCNNYLYTTGCSSNDALIKFNIANLNHTTGCSGTSGQANSGYGSFTTTTGDTISLVQGATYSWTASINFSGNHWLQMWIDLNNNGVFETGEALLAVPFAQPANTADPLTFGSSFTLSAVANAGYHRFRVRIVYATSSFDACTQYTYGEVQDYTCNITAPNCPVPTSAAATSIDLTSAQVNWTCAGCTGSYIVEYGPAATFTTPGTGSAPGTNGTIVTVAAGNTSVVITGLTQGTQYRYFVRENCSASDNGYSVNSGSQTFTTLLQLTLGTIVANQQTTTTVIGASNANIWRLDLPAMGTTGTLTLNSITFTSANTTDADVAASGVKLWTGTTTAPSSLVGTAQTFASGSVTFSGLSVNIPAGTTYLWLTNNVSSAATVGDVLDVKINTGDITIAAGGLAVSPGTQPAALLDPSGNVLIDYCDNYLYTTGCNSGDALISFNIANLSHTGSGCSGSGSNQINTGYGNFTVSQPTINLIQGGSYSWTASINYSSGNHWLQMWIDLNNNGFFESGEALLASPFPHPSGVADPATFGSSFTLSASANPGNHRFRVRVVWATSSFDACTQYTYGEVHDYTCNIAAPDCPVPTSVAASGIDLTSAQANWTCVGCTGSYIVEYGPAATFTTPGTGTTTGTNGTIVTVAAGNTSVVLTGLSQGTQYIYYVREDCSASDNGYSVNSASKSFTTLLQLALSTIVANQQMATTTIGAANANIWRLDIPATGTTGTLALNSIKFTSGNITDADVAASGGKLWTGTTSGPSAQVGTAQTFAAGSVTFSGLNLNIPAGTTYLWLTYNVSATAILGNALDAKVNAGDIVITAGGLAVAPGTQPAALLDPSGNVLIDYCNTNLYSLGCTHSDDLTSFALSNLNNTNSGCSASAGGNGYANFTSSQPVISLMQGTAFTWTATVNYPSGHYLQMWIDYNDNGYFETGEALLTVPFPQPNSGGPINIPFGSTFTIPSTANTGTHRFRVRLLWATSSFGPCDALVEGTVEDYTCSIAGAPMTYISSTTTQNNSDVAPNTSNQLIVGLQVVTTGSLSPLSVSSIDFNTSGTTNAADISNARIYYTGTSSAFGATSQFGSTIASPNGSHTLSASQTLSPGTNYFWLTYDIPSGATLHNYAKGAVTSFVLSSVTETPSNTSTTTRQIELYCTPTAYIDCNSSPDGGISRVRLNAIDNSSGCAASGDYSNYTVNPSPTQTTTLVAGQTYTIVIDRGVANSVSYTVKAWIDYNHDGTFANSAPELIYSFTSSSSNGFSGSFNVPIDAGGGNTRMRIRMAKNVSDACDSPGGATNYGETEDYVVNIDAPCADAGISSATPASGSVCPGVTTSIMANGITGTNTILHWWGASGGTGTDYGTSNPLTGVGAGTYYARVTGDCGSPAETSTTVSSLSTSSSSSSATACNSYVWNGSTYTSSGAKTYGTSNAAGCDSTATLSLTINSSSTGSLSATGCDSYAWNGTTYTGSGDKTFSTTNAAGCDSVATLHLTINSSSSGSDAVTACESYVWNGSTYTTGGDKTHLFTGGNAVGCDSTATLHLTINPCNFNYTVKLFLQGYYLGGNKMSPLLHMLGAASPTVVDSVTIELRDSVTNQHSLIYSYKDTLSSNGNVICSFPSADTGYLYIVIKHRNAVETWSKTAVHVSPGGSYDFTTAANKAFGSMLNLGSGVFGIYNGDVNQDGYVDGSDKTSLQSVLSTFKVGVYNMNDITGDGFVDEDDYRVLIDNIPLSISVSRPQ